MVEGDGSDLGWFSFLGVDCEGPEPVIVRMAREYFQVRLKR